MATTGNKVLSGEELRVLIKYWIVVLSAAITYLLFFGISKM